MTPVASASRAQVGERRPAPAGRRRRPRWTTTVAGIGEPGNACWIVVVGLHDRQAARQVAEAEQPSGACRSAGSASTTSSAAETARAERRMAQRRAQDRAPDARLAARALERAAAACAGRAGARRTAAPRRSTRIDPCGQHGEHAAVDAVAELAEQRREHGQRADHRHERRRSSRRAPSDVKILEPASSMPAIAISTVTPEISTACPDVAAARCSASRPRVPGRALLALALHVEERVVDPDRHAHQQDHRARRVRRVRDVADERREADRAEHRREREQHRQAGGDERAEREQQDQERRAAPTAARRARSRLPIVSLSAWSRAGLAELGDRKPGCARCTDGDGGEHRLRRARRPSSRVAPSGRTATSAECPSFDAPAALTLVTSGRARSGDATSSDARRNAGEPASPRATGRARSRWRTCLMPASARIRSARAVSPFALLDVGQLPRADERSRAATAATTSASQPKVAVFQCAALQRPARAARFGLMACSPCSISDMPRGCRAGDGATRTLPGVRGWGYHQSGDAGCPDQLPVTACRAGGRASR